MVQCDSCSAIHNNCCSSTCCANQLQGVPWRQLKENQKGNGNGSGEGKRHTSTTIPNPNPNTSNTPDTSMGVGYMESINQYCEIHSTDESLALHTVRRDTYALYPNAEGITRMLCSPLQGR